MHDLIDRQAAIDAILAVTGNSSVRELYEHVQEHGLSDMWSGGVNAAIDIIIAVPPIQQEPCADTISRQAAIDALDKRFDSIPMEQTTEILLLRKDLRALPSAQPETHEERTETHACDLIDRQAAIEALKEAFNPSIVNFVKAKIAIENLPSAQPEPKWIPCSERLPEERQEIIATTTDNAWGDVVIIRTYYKEMHKSVIAWMPLPKPYRAERRTDE